MACVNDLHTRALYTQKSDARYAYIAPFYRQAKDVAWTYLKKATRDTQSKTRESELSVELFNGSKISLYGADNPDALRGIYLDGVVLDEFGDCRPSLWAEVIFPTLTDRQGWATFIGTPKGKNHFFDIRELARSRDDWFYLEVKASESRILLESELEIAKTIMDENQYAQEYECSFEAAVRGTYYASIIKDMEAEGRIATVEVDPDLEVNVAMDIGFSDSTAIWFWQETPSGIHVVDYLEGHGERLDYYLAELEAKPYKYDTLYLPHDARAKTLQTGRSTVEQCLRWSEDRELGWTWDILPRLDLQDGINAVRLVLRTSHIDATRCKFGIEALRAYARRYDEVKEAFSDKPDHNWASNGADAFRYLSLVAKGRLGENPLKEIVRRVSFLKPMEYCLDDLFKDREKVNWNRQRL